MPCYCEPDENELDRDRKILLSHAKEMVTIMKRMVHPTERYPQILIDTMKLLGHLYTGECDEKKEV